jgi:D-alanine-D-alanine ligase
LSILDCARGIEWFVPSAASSDNRQSKIDNLKSEIMHLLVLHNEAADDSAVDDRDVLVQRDAVLEALRSLGHDAAALSCTLNLATVSSRLKELRPDVVFNLVESLGGTDRLMPLATLLLDALNIPHTGCGTETILATSNKVAAKQRMHAAGLPTAGWLSDGSSPCPLPDSGRCILKPIWEHASVGMSDDAVLATTGPAEVEAAIQGKARATGRPHFAEAFIDGREFNLSLLAADETGPSREPTLLPPAEIDFSAFPAGKPRIVGHSAKWDVASDEYHQTPRTFDFAGSDASLLDELARLALACWSLFGLRGYARVDFRVDREGRPWILEVNANPCLSPDAGFAAALARAGIPYSAAIRRIVEDALRQSGRHAPP